MQSAALREHHEMSTKIAKIYRFNVHLSPADKRLLDRLVRRKGLKKVDVVRQLIRIAAAENDDEKRVVNG